MKLVNKEVAEHMNRYFVDKKVNLKNGIDKQWIEDPLEHTTDHTSSLFELKTVPEEQIKVHLCHRVMCKSGFLIHLLQHQDQAH